MSKVLILTDSTAYLPETYIQTLPIRVTPLVLNWEGKTYRDGIDILPNEFYARLAKASTLPTTSQLSAVELQQKYQAALDEGYDVLGLFISSGLSGSYQAAELAKQTIASERVQVLDTKLVSMALGFQVLAAARAAADGASLSDCLAVAKDAYTKIKVYFTVDTLKYLHAGGRIGSAKRIFGTALDIKPLLQINDGKIDLVASVRSHSKAVERMIEMVKHDIDGRTPLRISVFHALEDEEAASLTTRLQQELNPIENIPSFVSPVIGTHVGPGTISIAFMAG
jgi:DegV family protein with EDD domain